MKKGELKKVVAPVKASQVAGGVNLEINKI